MNGCTGEAVGVQEDVGRHKIRLDGDSKKTILVKPINLRHIPLAPLSVRQEAESLVIQLNGKVQMAHRRHDPHLSSILKESRSELARCIEMDRCCVMAYAALGQCATMVKNHPEALQHMQRAVANMHALVVDDGVSAIMIRSELASCYGEVRNLQAEAKQLRIVLSQEPHYLQARFLLGQNMAGQGCLDDAIATLQTVLDTPNDPNFMTEAQAGQLKSYARTELVKRLATRILQLSDPKEKPYQKTLDYADKITSLGVEVDLNTMTRVLACKALALARLERWDEARDEIRAAHDHGASLPPQSKCAVLYYGGNIQELRGDHAAEAKYPDMARACWEEAMALYEASEETHHDEAARYAHLRVQAKLSENMETIIDRSTGNVMTRALGDGVSLELLPHGPVENSSSDTSGGEEKEQEPVVFI